MLSLPPHMTAKLPAPQTSQLLAGFLGMKTENGIFVWLANGEKTEEEADVVFDDFEDMSFRKEDSQL